MIRFDRSKDTLQALSSRNEISLEEALGVFLDICEDIKGNCGSVENLDIENGDKLLANLSRSGRIFLKIMKKNADAIEAVDLGGRIKRQEEQIEAHSKDLEQKEQQLDDFEVRVRSEIQALEAKKKVYENRKKELDEKRQYLIRLEEECRLLESQIEQIESVSEKSLEDQRAVLQASLDDHKKNVEFLKNCVDNCEKELQAEKKMTDDTELIYKQKKEELDKVQEHIRTLEQKIVEKGERVRQLLEKEQNMCGTVEELKGRQNRLDADVVLYQNEIDRLREHLANSDLEKLKIEKEKLANEKMAMDAMLSEEKMEQERLRQAIIECQEERIAQKENAEKEQSQLSDMNEMLKIKIDELNECIEIDTKQRNQLEKTLNDAETRQKQLKKWFETLDMPQYEAKIKKIQGLIAMYEDAQKALFYETDELKAIPTISNQEANDKKEELRVQFKQIETSLEVYRKKYNTICELLSD